jgi:uncharacterized protein
LIYLDASAIVPLVVPAQYSVEVSQRLACETDVVTSDFATGEASSAISRLIRTAVATTEQAHAMLRELDALVATKFETIDISPADVRLGTMFVRRFDPPAKLPDAIHLAIAQRTGSSLFTLDAGMRRAASAFGIRLFELS